jgi:mannose-1-phosphate guanylyltransferase
MVHAVIMAGGGGTRFWPHSRKHRPKQFLTLAGEKTLIRATLDRVTPLIPNERILIVTGASYVQQVRNQAPELSVHQILAEPTGRNTAPCIALAAHRLCKEDPDAIMVVLPADHIVGKESAFRDAVAYAIETAAQGGRLLTFGVAPDRAETGYGYIKIGDPLFGNGPSSVYKVLGFVEKPDSATAEYYLASGRYLWNSGMFVWKAVDIITALDRYLPLLSGKIREITGSLGESDEYEALEKAYVGIEPVSIDHGVMERADNVVCLPIDVEWNDVGSWGSLDSLWGRDEKGNAIQGDVVMLESENCTVSSPHKPATLIGAEHLIVVDAPDVLMICEKNRAQDVGKLQDILNKLGYKHLL